MSVQDLGASSAFQTTLLTKKLQIVIPLQLACLAYQYKRIHPHYNLRL